jgi:hypothetical protein
MKHMSLFENKAYFLLIATDVPAVAIKLLESINVKSLVAFE